MGRELVINVDDEQLAQIYKDIKAELKAELTQEALNEYIRTGPHISIRGLLRDFGLMTRVESELMEKQVKDLNIEERLRLSIYWMMYQKLD